MDISSSTNLNHTGLTHNTDGFLGIPIESSALDALATKRRRYLLK